jgi:uncharacterized hydrophobic protein (TIGR00271 family)
MAPDKTSSRFGEKSRGLLDPSVWIVLWRRLVFGLKTPSTDADRRSVSERVFAGAQLSSGYFVLLICSCGIAELGLLQSSAAVVIGAMLISPLMGPIIGMGIALARLEPRNFAKSAGSLLLGAVLSILVGALIVWLSPLKEATPEILARTRPTLLDLVIAVLSGVVGAYVTITGRGAVIAGVAIATALMPPLAVTGFGLATGDWSIAGGSLLLFLTNVVAILAAVFTVARRYGFSRPRRTGVRWEEFALVVVLLGLATPLGFSLRRIVVEANQTNRVRTAINSVFSKASPHITSLSIDLDHSQISQVRAIVITRSYEHGASAAVSKRLDGAPGVQIQQILAASAAADVASTGGALGNRSLAQSQPEEADDPTTRLKTLLRSIATVNVVQSEPGTLRAVVQLHTKAALIDYKGVEDSAQRFFPSMKVELTPPFQAPPPVVFARGSSALDPTADATVQAAAWALIRWGNHPVIVTGSASPSRRGPTPADRALALARAMVVAQRLTGLGVTSIETRASVAPAAGSDPSRLWTVMIQQSADGAETPKP